MKTQCPNCKAKFNINETSVGKQAKCPKCVKPFTIEPFVETPVAVVTSAQSSEPAAPPAKSPEPVSPPVKTAEPVEPPKSVVPPMKSPAPIAPAVKIPAPAAPPAISVQPAAEVSPESKTPSKAALSKAVFVYCWMGVRIVAGVLGALGLVLTVQKGAKSTLIMTFVAADIFLIGSVAIEYALFYKMWAAIKDDKTSISPAKAVGFLLIPVFNIYWALLMVTGLEEDYNAFIQRRAIKTKDLPMSLYLIYAFAFILSETVLTVPMLCVFTFLRRINRAFEDYTVLAWVLLAFLLAAGIVHFITYILFALRTCNAINALPERQSR
jgi:predicted Zn finger-like uncharacterized protein